MGSLPLVPPAPAPWPLHLGEGGQQVLGGAKLQQVSQEGQGSGAWGQPALAAGQVVQEEAEESQDQEQESCAYTVHGGVSWRPLGRGWGGQVRRRRWGGHDIPSRLISFWNLPAPDPGHGGRGRGGRREAETGTGWGGWSERGDRRGGREGETAWRWWPSRRRETDAIETDTKRDRESTWR